MSRSREVRVPFMDYRFVELLARTPPERKLVLKDGSRPQDTLYAITPQTIRELDGFLKAHDLCEDFTLQDLEQELEGLRRLGI